MKKLFPFMPYFVLALTLFVTDSCNNKNDIDYSKMHVYKPQEIKLLIENAYKIEMIGEPMIERTDNPTDSSVIVKTTQIYKILVARTKDNHLVPIAEVTESARRANDGPIVITSSCEMTCTPVRPGESCNIQGCMPTDKCGCTQGSCGNNCTTDLMCHQGLAGFGFGIAIIF